MNDSKTSKFKTTDNLNDWFYVLEPIKDKIIRIFEDSDEIKNLKELHEASKSLQNEEISNLIELSIKHFTKRDIYKKVSPIHIKNEINLTIDTANESELISSYLLSIILSKIEKNKENGKNYYANKQQIVNLSFFLYTKKISYSSTQKLIRILSLLLEKDSHIVKMSIEENIATFESFIFIKPSSDWIDLILFFQSYDINLPINLFKKISDQLLKEENPVKIATLCIYLRNSRVSHKEVARKINGLIKTKIDQLNWKNFFEDKRSWWVFIFLSYPNLKKNIKQEITDNLKSMKNELNNESPNSAYVAKKLIIEFLLESKVHFIEWDFSSLNYYKEFYFYTKDRTVFNPDIIDQLNISR